MKNILLLVLTLFCATTEILPEDPDTYMNFARSVNATNTIIKQLQRIQGNSENMTKYFPPTYGDYNLLLNTLIKLSGQLNKLLAIPDADVPARLKIFKEIFDNKWPETLNAWLVTTRPGGQIDYTSAINQYKQKPTEDTAVNALYKIINGIRLSDVIDRIERMPR